MNSVYQESPRSALTAELAKQLKKIRLASYARTDIGRNVIIRPMDLNQLDAPCCLLIPGNDSAASNRGLSTVQINYEIRAYSPWQATKIESHPANHEYPVIDAMIEDIRSVIEYCDVDDSLMTKSDGILYQGSDPIYSEDAGSLVGVTVSYLIYTPWRDVINS